MSFINQIPDQYNNSSYNEFMVRLQVLSSTGHEAAAHFNTLYKYLKDTIRQRASSKESSISKALKLKLLLI